MPTARREAGCASYRHYLIVAGGDTPVKLNSTDTVEVLDTNTHRWYKTPSLPNNGSRITLVTIEEYIYLLPAYSGVITEARTFITSQSHSMHCFKALQWNRCLGKATRYTTDL